jgi:TatD DNase family protein
MKLIDIHAHLHDKAFDQDRDELINNLKSKDIFVVTIGTDSIESRKAVELANQYDNVWCTIGVHPCDNVEAIFDEVEFSKMLNDKVVAIGECGLDYYRLSGAHDIEKEKLRQKELFEKQIIFASNYNLPLMLHGRPSKGSQDAYEDMLVILRKYNCYGNVHFFVGDSVTANKFLELGFTFSLGGVMTLTNEYDDMIRSLPLESIHLETDSPYVAPKEYRGKRNTPEYLPIILNRLCEIKSVSQEELIEQLHKNAERVFGIKV